MIDERIDRSVVQLMSFDEAGSDDIAYWISRTPTERVEALEYLRRWVYGDTAVDARLQRVLDLVELGRDWYLLIGGYAVCMYGHIRPTKDMDVWVATDPTNIDRLREVLDAFGFSRSNLPNPLFQPPRTMLRMGVPPNCLEVLSEIAGVTFPECFARRRLMDIDGIVVPVIDLDDLKKNKSATGRAGDRADVERLEKLKRR
jgi:hypothetical protein